MRLFLILFALTAVGLKPMAGSAQELQLRGNDRWVVIAARQDQAAAVAVASSFRTLNPIVARATNSWFVVLAGPFNNPNLPALSRKFGLPDDAYLSRGQAYDRLVWKGSGSPAAGGDFEKARSWFTSLPAATRIEYQHLLTAAGHWPAVSNPEFGKRLFAAIQEFQESERFPPSGLLNSAELSRLRSKASPALLAWNLQPVTHPIGGVKLWVPQGFGLAREYEDGVISLTSNYASVLFSHFSGASVEHAYQAVRRLVIRDDVIDYEVMRDGFFVIASHNASLSSYTRFERHALGVVGFTLMWPPNSFGFGDRLSTIMSDLFRANVSLSENRTPPYWTPSYEAPRAETATVAAPAVDRKSVV